MIPVTIKYKDEPHYMEQKRKEQNVAEISADIDILMKGKEIWEQYLKIEGVNYDEENWVEKAKKRCSVKSGWLKKKKFNPTLYYEDEDGGKKVFCKKRIIFPLCKTLSDFEHILRSNLRGDAIDKKGLTLHYVEGTMHIALSRCSQRF